MSINLTIGCMYSGKTSALLNIARNCKMIGKKVLLINYIEDNRYTTSDKITTHDKISIDCSPSGENILDVCSLESYSSSEVICINEGQFFKNLVSFCKKACEEGKDVYVCGLDGDFNMNKFGEILDLIPICDNLQKLKAICMGCKNGTLASFTKKIIDSEKVVEIGSTDMYIPVCRKCYLT